MSAVLKVFIAIIVIAAVLGSGCTQPAAVQQPAACGPDREHDRSGCADPGPQPERD